VTLNRHGWVLWTDGARDAVANILATQRDGIGITCGAPVGARAALLVLMGLAPSVMALTCLRHELKIHHDGPAQLAGRAVGPLAPGPTPAGLLVFRAFRALFDAEEHFPRHDQGDRLHEWRGQACGSLRWVVKPQGQQGAEPDRPQRR
jgi:hypothetical protein